MIHQQQASWRRRILITIVSAMVAGGAAFSNASATVPAPNGPTVSVASATRLSASDTVGGALPAYQSLHIVVSLNLRNQVQLSRDIATATNLRTAAAKRTMTRAEFAANYAPTTAGADAVAKYLTDAGFSNVTIAPNRLLVSAYGTPNVVQAAFRTTLAQVQTARGEQAYANTSSAQVPTSLQGIVQTVLGLQTVHHPHTLERIRTATTASASSYNPTQFPHIYGGDNLPVPSTVTVGIITAGNMAPTLADLDTFTTQNHLAAVNTEVKTVGYGSGDTSGVDEWNLDSQTIIGMTGGVKKLVFYAADTMSLADLTAAMNAAVTDTVNNPRVINMSFGGCEIPGSASVAENQIFQAAIANGQTFSASSGDEGANCNKMSDFGVEDPSSSPYVVAVGGTLLSTTASGDYAGETAWTNGGGGISTFEPKPPWQTTVAGNYRAVPDIAFDGDPASGAQVIIDGNTYIIGGTSLSSPIFVGAWARLLESNPNLTFAAPYLYNSLTSADYNDVTTGSNATPQSHGQYSAGVGFDLTTGFGSFKLAHVNGAIGTPGPPSVSVDFVPPAITADQNTTLKITLSNRSQPNDPAVLSADFTATLPSGLTIASTPNAATSCVGAVSTVPGGSSITLPSGSSILADSACTISVDVSAVGNGVYTSTVAAGALHSNLGNSAYPASAELTVGNGLSYPIASVDPGTVKFALLADTSATKLLKISNIGGGTLNYSLVQTQTAAQPLDSVNYQWDDGSVDANEALNGNDGKEYEAVWLNRFAATGPVTIHTISIYWPQQTRGTLVGQKPDLVAYYDADGDGDLSNAVRLGSDSLVSINEQGAFQDYTVNLKVPGAGDVYIGFADAWAATGSPLSLRPAAADSTHPHGHSYIVYNGTGAQPDLTHLGQNGAGDILPVNLMIRASGTTSYSASQCTTPANVAWLSESPTSGAVLGGHGANVTVSATANGLANGTYTALLCATTNDTEHTNIQVPVSLLVGSTDVPPVAGFISSSHGMTASFTDQSRDSDGSVVGWSWDFGDGSAPDTTQNPTHTYAAQGTYTVTETVTDNGGATDHTTSQVSVDWLPPTLATSFLSSNVPAGVPSTLTITLANPNPADATLASTFTDALPAGLNTVPGSVATTCGGSVTATQTATSFALPAQASIPANGSCTVTGDVTAASAGTYVNQLAAAALSTDKGANVVAASAALQVAPGLAQAVVTPNALTFNVLAGGRASDTMNIANPGHAALTWSIAQASAQIRLGSTEKYLGSARVLVPMQRGVLSHADSAAASSGPVAAPFIAPKDLSFAVDAGVDSQNIGYNDGNGSELASLYLNRFAPPSGAGKFTIDTISVLWPAQTDGAANALIGKQATLVAYYDADHDGDPSNAVFLGESPVTISNIGTYTTYNVSFDVPGGGDIYVGFEDTWAEPGYKPQLHAAAEDTSAGSHQQSYIVAMDDGGPPYLVHLANNTIVSTVDDAGVPGNLMIRATGNLKGGPTASCTNPSLVPWVSEVSDSGTVGAGANSDVRVKVDATGMAAGSYTALLCVATNDPGHAIVEVPVQMTVNASCDGVTDRIFAGDFDGDPCTPPADIISGNFNADVPDNVDGVAVDLVTGTHHPYGGIDDLNLYDAAGSGAGVLSAYWYSGKNAASVAVGGIVDSTFSLQVLHAGDTVGPGIAFSGKGGPMSTWSAGKTGYIGIAFYNEQTQKLNYGYIHLTTTAPDGFPAHLGAYAYNADGGPITIP